jgi:opacity protein-like surface antigen
MIQKLLCSVFLVAFSACAQSEIPRFTFNVGGGFTNPKGPFGSRTDTGWNIGAGAGYNFNSYVSLTGQFRFNNFAINQSTLENLNFPDGAIRIMSATLEPVVHLLPRSPVDLYVTGGGGLYHVTREFTQPALASGIGFDPFFGFYPAAFPVSQVLSSYSVNKPGFNGGVGVAFGTKWHGKIFAEARYSRVLTGNNRYVDFIPVSFGFRW